MIQSGIFDSINMNIKKITNSILLFVAKRLAEIFGILVLISGILLLISLISYSPEDPNFIFPENTDIKNILGFRGSYISDLFLTHYYSNAFTLYINGNGGFIGNFLNQTYLNQILLINNQISYYFLVIIILLLAWSVFARHY